MTELYGDEMARGKLNRQRYTIQTRTDLHDVRHVFVAKGEATPDVGATFLITVPESTATRTPANN